MTTLEQRERPTSSLLVAADPAALANAQHRMIEDVAHKIELAKIEATEAKLMAETMTVARLGSAQAKAMHKRATSRVGYLVKIKQALEAGYCMMPDMEGPTIAVRLDQIGPMPAARVARRWAGNVPDEKPRGLPMGQGEYHSPRQEMGTQKNLRGQGFGGQGSVPGLQLRPQSPRSRWHRQAFHAAGGDDPHRAGDGPQALRRDRVRQARGHPEAFNQAGSDRSGPHRGPSQQAGVGVHDRVVR